MAGTSPTIAIWDAVALAINTGANPPSDLVPGWPRYYFGQVEPMTIGPNKGKMPPTGYYIFGMSPESSDDRYNGRRGSIDLMRIHCWGKTPHAAERLYAWLKTLLHGEALSLEGHVITDGGSVSKSGPFAGPPGVEGRADSWQVEANYDVTTGEM